MPVASVVPTEPPRRTVEDEQVEPVADVLPFSRLHLGNGARDGIVNRLNDYPGGSPVYLPDDPRLSE